MLELRGQVDALRASLEHGQQPPNLIGSSSGFRHAYSLIDKAAATHVTVLLLGETGVGKERFAPPPARHEPPRNPPFMAVNLCRFYPMSSSNRKPSASRRRVLAPASRAGKFERADGGTLFLDERSANSLPPRPSCCGCCRRRDRAPRRRSGQDQRVRLVAATNVDLRAGGQGRSLPQRPLLPAQCFTRSPDSPCARRVADIQPLVEAMVQRFSALHDKRIAGITDKALRASQELRVAGNIRGSGTSSNAGSSSRPQNDWIEIEHLFAEPQDFGAVSTPLTTPVRWPTPSASGKSCAARS